MRTLAKVLVLFGAAIVAVIIVARYMGNTDLASQTPAVTSPASTPAATTTVQSPTQTTTAPPAQPGKPANRPAVKAAVQAAALATNNLSVAQFLPAPQMKQVVSQLVMPSRRSVAEKAYAQTGPLLARQLGYAGTNDVLVRANYFVNTLKYKVDRIVGSNATVRLYTLTHFVSSLEKEYWVPSITIIQLRLEGGKWLYVRSYDPPASQMPLPRQNLSLQETEAAFQPYLKEFKTYESSE
ncbi:MAG: hypothetical protein ACREMY_02075 [bacterium]